MHQFEAKCGGFNLLIWQVKAELATEQRNASEALQDAESRHEQVVAELREAADEAGLAADSTTQAVEQWRRRSGSSSFRPPST